jgi:lipoate-protein ligase A
MDGTGQMAADEVLLEAAGAGVASLRFYIWPEATLSLGYFQPGAVRRSDPLLADLAWVRRPTGGSALVHHREVTYALAVPAGPPWQTGEPWPLRMHRALVAALAELGVRANLAPEERRLGEVLCFLHFTPGDVLIGGAKVVGSAQRKQRGALVQHGGILLAQSPHTPSLPGIAELSGVALSPKQVAEAAARELARATGWAIEPADWSPAERARIEQLRAEKYATPRWNMKR